MGCVALLPAFVLYLGSRFRKDVNSGLWALVYKAQALSSACHSLWDAYEDQRLWYSPVILYEVSIMAASMRCAEELTEVMSDGKNKKKDFVDRNWASPQGGNVH